MSIRYVSLVKDFAILAGPRKMVLQEIADRANPDHGDTCFPSVANIATRTGYHPRTVQRALRWLCDHGWLAVAPQIDHQGQHASKYRLNVARLEELERNAPKLQTDFSETEFEPFEEEKNRLKTRGDTQSPPPDTVTRVPWQGVTALGVTQRHPNRKEPKKNPARDPALFEMFLKARKPVGQTFEQWEALQ